MKALQAFGLGLILILPVGIAMAIRTGLWPFGAAVGLAGLAGLLSRRLFDRVEGETKPPPPPARP